MFRSLQFLVCLFAVAPSVWAASNTGRKKPKQFRIEVTWEPYSPDGFERNMALINGQFPGPKLELTKGDEVHFLVENKMPFNTSIHFHGA